MGTSKELSPNSFLPQLWAAVSGGHFSSSFRGIIWAVREGYSSGFCFLFNYILCFLLSFNTTDLCLLWSCFLKLLEVLQMYYVLWCLSGNNNLSQHLLNRHFIALSYLVLTKLGVGLILLSLNTPEEVLSDLSRIT